MIQYAAKLDAQGNPEKDANGRFIKGNLIGYTVMEKRTGWGTGTRTTSATANGSTKPSRRTRAEHRGQSYRLLQLPQAARQAGFRLPYDKLKAAAK